VTGLCFSYPFDTIKIRLQTRPGLYRNTLDCFVKMARQEGVLSLWRGLTSPVLGYGAINATVFGTYTNVSQWISEFSGYESRKENKVWQSSMAGVCAGIASSFVRTPVERIKTIMQTATTADGKCKYRNTFHCVSVLAREQGVINALMRGLMPTMLREASQYAVYYPAYEVSKRLLTPEGGELSPIRIAVCGCIAGIAQWVPPMYCIDVIKSRIQEAPPGKYNGMWDCFLKSYRKEGIMVLFKGQMPAIYRAGPLHAFVFVGYELTMKLLEG